MPKVHRECHVGLRKQVPDGIRERARRHGPVRSLCVKVPHRFLPGTRRVIVGQRKHQLDERSDCFGIPGMFLRRDRENAASGVVAGDSTRRGRVGKILHAGFLIGVRKQGDLPDVLFCNKIALSKKDEIAFLGFRPYRWIRKD